MLGLLLLLVVLMCVLQVVDCTSEAPSSLSECLRREHSEAKPNPAIECSLVRVTIKDENGH